MKNNHSGSTRKRVPTTKKVNGTDLSQNHFLFVGHSEYPRTWLLPICDRTSREKTIRLIETNLANFDTIVKSIPSDHHWHLWVMLAGAAQSFGIPVPERTLSAVPPVVVVSDTEMFMLLAERAASRVLDEIESLYQFEF